METIDYYFFNKESDMFIIVFNFVIGLAFSPYSDGGRFFIFFLLTTIVLDIYLKKFEYDYMHSLMKASSSLMGFVVGRTISGYTNPFSNQLTKETQETQTFAEKRSLIYI